MQVAVHVLLEVHVFDRLIINSTPDLLFFLTSGHDLIAISGHGLESTRTQHTILGHIVLYTSTSLVDLSSFPEKLIID